MPLTPARRALAVGTTLLALAASVLQAPPVTAAARPSQAPSQAASQVTTAASDPFFTYDGPRPLASVAPGTVLKSRTLRYHVLGVPTPVQAVQLVYRSTDAQGRPAANVTSILRLPTSSASRVVSYQSAYDSLDPEDGPSRAIAGDVRFGGLINHAESLLFAPLLLQGYTVIVPDTEGQDANFAAGPEYGMNTLDSIRAALGSAETRVSPRARVALLGYSGGAIGTSWAAALAPSYAPEVNQRLVGMAEGGLLVAPAHNLRYVDGSLIWAGVAPMAILGIARSYDIDFSAYLSPYGESLLASVPDASILDVLARYPGLTWRKLVKAPYVDPSSIPEFVEAANRVNLGSAPTPTIPVFIGQGANGAVEGTSNGKPGIGPGDGVMIAGDVRTLARQYCTTNRAVRYSQYDALSHVLALVPWAPEALSWIGDRFAGRPAPSSCGRIPVGNPLTPEVYRPAPG